MVQEGHLTVGNPGLPAPLDCAALGGHGDIIRFFQELRPRATAFGYLRGAVIRPSKHLPLWTDTVGYLKGAMQSGNVDIVRLAAALSKEEALACGLPRGYYKSFHTEVLQCAENWEVDDELLRCYTVWGNLATVERPVQDYGVHVRHPRDRDDDHLLVNAAGFFHDKMVKFLLDNGADPRQGEGTSWGSALSAAGSLVIVRKLLDRVARAGARITTKPHPLRAPSRAYGHGGAAIAGQRQHRGRGWDP